jgi:hypothetical protein
MTAITLNNIYTHIYTAATFNSILASYFRDKNERDEFRQHMFLEVYKLKEEFMINIYNQGGNDLIHFYAAMVKNQVCSDSSPWAKQRQNGIIYNEELLTNLPYEDDPIYINKKNVIIDVINRLQGKHPKMIEDFDHFKWYFFENMSYRQIEKKLTQNGTPISRHTVRTKVIRAEALIKNYIKNNYKDDKLN